MILLHLKTALVSIVRRRLSSLVSIVSLAVGIAVAILITIFVLFETSYDTEYPDAERIYRINWVNTNTGAHFATFFNPLSARIAEGMPGEIETLTRFTQATVLATIAGEKQYVPIMLSDPNIFETFPQENIFGDAKTILTDMNSIVLSRSAALKYFGTPNAIGETLTIDDKAVFRVGAIVEDTPLNRHYSGHMFININTIPTLYNWPGFWEANRSDQLYHYVKLKPGIDPKALEKRILEFIEANFFEGASEWVRTPLQPVTDIHFDTELQNEVALKDELTGIVKNQRQRNDIYVFAIVGMLTLVIAAFNFLNLQIVQITNRLREIGLRKVLGATRQTTATQFQMECVILAVFSALLGLALAEAALPIFSELVGSPITTFDVFTMPIISLAFVISVIIAAIASLYPAALAAKLQPSAALREEVSNDVNVTKVRYILVAAQFAIAAGLVIASSIIGNQVDFALNKPLGFSSDGIIKLNTSSRDAKAAYHAIEAKLSQHPAIESISAADIVPGQDLENGYSFSIDGALDDRSLSTRMVMLDHGAIEMLDIDVLAGRAFSEDFPSDLSFDFVDGQSRYSASIILNETAVKAAGWSNADEAIGQTLISRFNRTGTDYEITYTVVGVVADMHYRSIRSNISPISYFWATGARRQMLLKAAPGKDQEAMTAATAAFAELVPSVPPRASFLEDDYAAFYEGENRTFALVISFAGIAVIVACIGLYGVTSYLVNRRIREIGVRKVLGATITQLVTLLSWKQTRMALIASVAAWPIVWYFMHDWLQNFAYRTDMQFTPFLVSTVLTVVLAAVTTGVRTYLAARIKPIYSLRHD